MSYPTEFRPEQVAALEKVTPTLLELSEGKRVVFQTDDVQELQELRWLIYAWMSPFHANNKSHFRLRILSKTELEVQRIGGPKVQVVTAFSPSEYVKEFLLDIENEIEASELIAEAFPGDLDTQELVLKEWREKCQ